MGKPPASQSFAEAASIADVHRIVMRHDHAERYSDEKNYEQYAFPARYGADANAPLRSYTWHLYEIHDRGTGAMERWAVAVENLTSAECVQLAPYCSCPFCRYIAATPWFLRWLLRSLPPPWLARCILSGPKRVDLENLMRARAARQLATNEKA